ncbi:endoplasmic reticulum aminopeptidase 2-like [Erpetoichthys calabaricus]|uniref:Aminopeptidase n=1 Tax=Erpetoichthys calabaricus TaxID=27687 RepID=A0A8C4S1A7_ERPCA|nr:endoplasmic reticulum aminopeptidase 2-like [Erpetoichthys calabaricus]XP_051785464.1 endoplasmic reticulum aminopeptidase 2-like [Erpetoichthys calabaricus]XP_051785465.1 endoplasmic reticulum aminopeptidase 2-like [Erpetoichthys calabaricus]
MKFTTTFLHLLLIFATDAVYGSHNYATVATNGQPFPWAERRLPDNIFPVHYNLLIHPNLTTLKFTGSVKIEVDVTHNTNTVILHSKHLQIVKASIEDEMDDSSLGVALQVLEYPPHEQIALLSANTLLAGKKYFVYLSYAANLSEGFHGFYKSTYPSKGGETRILASTHFEPTSARMAFPCFDEPAFKANYSITIRRGAEHIALSNMPKVKTVHLGDGLYEDHFDISVRMSTYLVAFIVCDFKSVSKMTSTGVKISVYAVPDKWNQTHYALEAAVKLLEFYEKYFNIYYPLPKQDLVAIPDFQLGAMENWGLTTYRETSLLFDPQTSSVSDKLWVTLVIGHELAHQWFGNLVTMEWWNDIWLNEGFARYMEIVSVEATYPELQADDYLLGTCFAAIGRDSMNSSRPITTAAESPTEINEMFDTVSYEKGACILHMLRSYLSKDVFQSGIVRYLRKYSYRNAKNEDLWNSMANTCSDEDFTSGEFCYSSNQAFKNRYKYGGEHLDLKTMMNTWTLQKGIPLVIVDQQDNIVRIRQERFLRGIFPTDPVWPSLQEGYLWHIPLTYITSNSRNIQRHLLETKSGVIDLRGNVSWIKFNTDMNGYYIVHYEGDGWDKIIKLLKENHTLLSHKDRTHLIHNAFQLVSAGKLSLDRALDLLLYLRFETHNVPLLQGLGYLETIFRMIEKAGNPDVAQNLKNYILKYFQDVIDKQTWSDEGSISDRRLRSEVLNLACDFDHPMSVKKANELFKEWVRSNGTLSLPTDVIMMVYSVGAKSAEGWDFLLEKYKISLSGAEQSKILSALINTKDVDKLLRLLHMGMKEDTIRMQDLPSAIYSVAINPVGHSLAWNFVKKYWNELVEKFELGSNSIRTIIIGTTSHFSSKEDLNEVKMFFESIKEHSSQLRATQMCLENIEKNIRWLERNLETLKTWLLKNIMGF